MFTLYEKNETPLKQSIELFIKLNIKLQLLHSPKNLVILAA